VSEAISSTTEFLPTTDLSEEESERRARVVKASREVAVLRRWYGSIKPALGEIKKARQQIASTFITNKPTSKVEQAVKHTTTEDVVSQLAASIVTDTNPYASETENSLQETKAALTKKKSTKIEYEAHENPLAAAVSSYRKEHPIIGIGPFKREL
jgi:phosphoglycolate phosphatase-like HAD superfamily hydrolase